MGTHWVRIEGESRETEGGTGVQAQIAVWALPVRNEDPQGIRRTAGNTFQTEAATDFHNTTIRGEIEPKTLTLREVAANWRSQQLANKGFPLCPSTLGGHQRLLRRVLVGFGAQDVRHETRQHIEDWRARELYRATNKAAKGVKLIARSMQAKELTPG